MRAVEAGATFIVTRHGTPIAELHPLRRRSFIPTTEVMRLFGGDAPIDAERFFEDLEKAVDQGLSGE